MTTAQHLINVCISPSGNIATVTHSRPFALTPIGHKHDVTLVFCTTSSQPCLLWLWLAGSRYALTYRLHNTICEVFAIEQNWLERVFALFACRWPIPTGICPTKTLLCLWVPIQDWKVLKLACLARA